MKNFFKNKKTKKFLLLIAAISSIIVVSAGGYFLYQEFWVFNQCRNTSESLLYDKASEALESRGIDKINDIEAEIKLHRNYDKDPNCLYPMVAGSLIRGDIVNAQNHFEKLEKVYSSKEGFADTYELNQSGNYNTLKASIEELTKNNWGGSTSLF
jgi:hypothetical protein